MITDTRNAKGWPQVFADGRGIASMRASIYTEAASGGDLRGLYADFLEEAADLLGLPKLRQPADAWREAAAAWDVIVDNALPPGDELRELIDRRPRARWDLQRRRDLADDFSRPRRDGHGHVRLRGRGARPAQLWSSGRRFAGARSLARVIGSAGTGSPGTAPRRRRRRRARGTAKAARRSPVVFAW